MRVIRVGRRRSDAPYGRRPPMTRITQVTVAVGVAGLFVASLAAAQTPAPAPSQNPTPGSNQRVAPRGFTPQRKSIVHHYPYPYPGAYHGDESGGFRNPGGAGRYIEY